MPYSAARLRVWRSTTGRSGSFGEAQLNYFKRIQEMRLSNPTLIGFGIHDQTTFQMANEYANGAIIGSAFIKAISNGAKLDQAIAQFIKQLR